MTFRYWLLGHVANLYCRLLDLSGYNVREESSGNIHIRKNARRRGEIVEGHKHHMDHTTFFFLGRWHAKVTRDDGSQFEATYTAPCHMLIKAEWEHEFTCLSDRGLFWCIYAHVDAQGRIVQQAENNRQGHY